MALRDFSETVMERAKRDAEFRVGLLTEAVEHLAKGEADIAKLFLRDYIMATVGFDGLAKMTDKKPESLMRMLRPSGNPSLDNISKLLASLHKHEGIEPRVSAE